MKKILLIGRKYEDGLESNFLQTVLKANFDCEILEMFPFKNLANSRILRFFFKLFANTKTIRAIVEKRIYSHISLSKYELIIFFTPAADYFSAKLVNACKSKSRFVIAWILDGPMTLPNTNFVDCDYDSIFLSDRGYLENLRGLTRAEMYPLSEGCRNIYNSIDDGASNDKVVHFGTLYTTRVIQIEEILKSGLDVDVYSGDYKPLLELKEKYPTSLQLNGPVFGITRDRVVRKALCVLNLQHPSSIDIINYRVFEVIGCGGLIATNGGSAVRRIFEGGGAIIFQTNEELIKELKFVLVNPEIAREHRKKALQIASENSLESRLKEILTILHSNKAKDTRYATNG